MCVLEPSKSEKDITVILLQHCNGAMKFDHLYFTALTYHVLLRHCVSLRVPHRVLKVLSKSIAACLLICGIKQL